MKFKFQGPIEASVGLLFGIFWGLLVTYLPGKDAANKNITRLIIFLGGALLAFFGSSAKGVQLPSSGAVVKFSELNLPDYWTSIDFFYVATNYGGSFILFVISMITGMLYIDRVRLNHQT